MSHANKPLVLIILDGWGHRTEQTHNPTQTIQTPTIDRLLSENPHLLLHASGKAVGLPEGQMGNSEVGHLHLGAGRKVPQDFVRINNDITQGNFQKNAVIKQAIAQAKKHDSAIHTIGLISPGGVHSHENQVHALLKTIDNEGIKKNYCHAFLDGRDTPPRSADASLKKLTDLFASFSGGQVASVCGRYYAMDRDNRWERTEKIYDLLTDGQSAFHADSASAALQAGYQRNENDEFIQPTAILNSDNQKITVMDNDVIIFMNFRADRAKQLTRALTEKNFSLFSRKKTPKLAAYLTLTQYGDYPEVSPIYTPLSLNNTLGECVEKENLKQLRMAETEKYAHVTYFLNGGIETPFPKEDRCLIPSPKVPTYDLQPEMSAFALTDALVDAISNQTHDLIVCNYANPDMVGHTGIEDAANKAVHVIDHCLSRIITALKAVGGQACITADHGNIEQMYDEQTKQPHTAHTNNLVPFIYIGQPASITKKIGALDDVAPTLLYLLGITPPKEMTGQSLVILSKDSS